MKFLAFIVFSLFLASCSSSISTTPATVFKVSGPLKYNRSISIPGMAKIEILWALSPDAGPANTYCQSAGGIDTATKTFTLTIPDTPPASAVLFDGHGNRFGFGFIIVTTDQIQDGIGSYDTYVHPGPIYGVINNTMIVYK